MASRNPPVDSAQGRQPATLLSVSELHISVEGKNVVNGVNLAVAPGEIHAIMGPNGSGKSSFVNTLMGHPKYSVSKGSVEFDGKDLLRLSPSDRAQRGLFLAFQYPKEIAGVTLGSFLFAAYKAQSAVRADLPKIISPIKFKKFLDEKMQALHMDSAFAKRFLNKGFSGGEKKKAEVLQMSVLYPRLVLMDETDSGLDIDALKIVAEGVNAMRSSPVTLAAPQRTTRNDRYPFSAIIVTHYARLLDYVAPDHVHVMVGGKIVESGGMELARELEQGGYAKYGIQDEGK